LRLKAEIYDHNSFALDSNRAQIANVPAGTKQGYTEFFSWGNDSFGQLGHGNSTDPRN